ncbi:MAG: LysM peptidoglycan-binding domain-containing protein [Flavobacteriales bacterium]|nr:LysM peptidoglycan-binding domain-containing protein [Flavobacteriales bacterium]
MKHIKHSILTLSLVFFSIVLMAQLDYVIEKRDGKDFYVHKVEKGHTLYSISKLYNVEIDQILQANPDAEKGLSIDQTLYIPVPEDWSEDKWHNPIGQEGSYLLHRVRKGETLFGISQQYKVDVNQILEDNPEANSGLSVDAVLRILINDVDEVVLERPEPEASDSLNTHLVKQGETLYSIARLYGIGIDQLESLNNGFPEGLKAGERIVVSGTNTLFALKTNQPNYSIPVVDSLPPGSRYRVAVMLPLYLNVGDSAKMSKKQLLLQEVGMEFYRGIRVALDSLEKYGLNAEVNFFDVTDSKGSAEKALQSEFVKKSHLIIGPLQYEPLMVVADFAVKRGIHIVCPVPQKNKILLNHPNLSKVVGSDISQVDFLAKYIAREHFTDNVILLNSMYVQDTRSTDMFRQAYSEAIKKYPAAFNKSLIEVKASGTSIGSIKGHLNPALKNVIVMTSDNESLLQDMLTKLALTSEEDYQIVVYGMSSWLDLKLIDQEYKERFHIAVPSLTHADYESATISGFNKAFYSHYKMEPGKFGMMGYDVMWYFGMGLVQYGLSFPNHFGEISNSGLLHTNFNFYRTGVESGFENRYFIMLEHRDYKLQPRVSSDAADNH